jgi:hypothetical protein
MRIFTASMIVGSFMLIGTLPAAGQSSLALGSGHPFQLAAAGVSTADKDSYRHQAREKTAEWQQKLQDFKDKAVASGTAAGNTAEDDLNKAWTRVETASRELQSAGDEGWENAKASFERASEDLTATWRKIHPEQK